MSILLARTSANSCCSAGRSRAGECAVVVAAGDRPPALVRLTLDVGLAGLALGIERVEGKLKIVLCRFARIDGTAGELANGFVHATEHPWRMRSGSLAGGRIEARQPPTAAGKGGVAASRHVIQAGLRARATAASLRGGVCFLSSETLRRSASIRLITRRGVGNVGLRSWTVPACFAFRCASSASS